MAFYYINDEAQLGELAVLEGAAVLGVDTETAGKNALVTQQSRVRLLQVASHQHCFVIDMDVVDPMPVLRPLFVDEKVVVVFHNAKFDVKLLMHHYQLVPNNIFCTYLAAKLLAMGSRRMRFNLREVVARYLDRGMDKTEQTSNFGANLSESQIRYAGEDADVLPLLYDKMMGQLRKNKLTKVAQLEFRTIVPVVAMELRGIFVDREALLALEQEYNGRALILEEALLEELCSPGALPGMNTLNINAPEQVKEALAERGILVEDTADARLRPLIDEHPFLAKLLEHRHLQKISGGAIKSLVDAILPETGRVHCSYHQIASASGRFACSDPNIQQVPREKAIRGCVKPQPGYLYVIADYSQVELRVAAGLSADPIMIDAYARGQDLHRLTAALTMDKPIDEVTGQERQAAKAINFGLIYAMGPRGLQASAKSSYGVDLSLEEATAFRDRYFKNYKGIARWQKESERLGKQRGFVRTASGRIRAYMDEEMRVTELLNIPVQGTAAEGLKCAMFLFWEKVQEDKLDAAIVAVIHDEIIVEVKREQAEWAKQVLEMSMVRGIQWLVPGVVFEAEAHIAVSWAEK